MVSNLLTLAVFALPTLSEGSWRRRLMGDMCNDMWSQLDGLGLGQMDALNVNTGVGINGPNAQNTAVGIGHGLNFGLTNTVVGGQAAMNGLGGVGGGQMNGNSMNVGVGAGVNLQGAQSTQTGIGNGINQQGAQANLQLWNGVPGAGQQVGFNNQGWQMGGMNQMNQFQQPMYQQPMYQQPMMPQQQNWGRRLLAGASRKLLNVLCDPKPTGPDVTCRSTGDPHVKGFDNSRYDFMAFGEFTLWQSPLLVVQVRQGSFGGSRSVASNHAVSFSGRLTNRKKVEIFHDGPRMRVTDPNSGAKDYVGKQNVLDAAARIGVPEVQIENDVMHFIFERREGSDAQTTLRVQLMSWGLNLELDVMGSSYRTATDTGICTHKNGWDNQVSCSSTLFTSFPPGGCDAFDRTANHPGQEPNCAPDIRMVADAKCGQCPDIVDPKGCVFDVCMKGDADFVLEILKACRLGQRLPKQINVGTGAAINMGTAISAQVGSGINYGTANVQVMDGFPQQFPQQQVPIMQG